MTTALVLLLLSAEWQEVKSKDGMRLETRTVAGKEFEQVRATARVAASPKDVCEWIWTKSPRDSVVRHEEKIKETDTERIVYQQVSAPVVSDRDYTTRFVRTFDAGKNTCEIIFNARNDLGPAKKEKFVRITQLDGAWVLTPEGEKTLITYTIYMEPGGSIPQWIARNGLRDAAFEGLEAVVKGVKK